MDWFRWCIDLFLHLDKHLAQVITSYGTYTYGLLFAVVFLETGLVVTPLLPGDSLLFAAGTFAARGSLNVGLLFGLLSFAAILGDTVNYAIGAYLGPKVFHFPKSRFFNPEHLRRTHAFYEKHGGKTIIIARFLPIIRTFAPFVAGIGAMSYLRFLAYNVVGGVLWVAICTFSGYFFGSHPFVQRHFSLVIMALVIIPGLPAAFEFVRQHLAARRARTV
jgi:membrane-associated protein